MQIPPESSAVPAWRQCARVSGDLKIESLSFGESGRGCNRQLKKGVARLLNLTHHHINSLNNIYLEDRDLNDGDY